MRAVAIQHWGGTDAVELLDLEPPPVAPDGVLVRVRAAGVNPVDAKIRDGALAGAFPASFPVVLGWDAAGVVERVGDAVTWFRPGDEVFGYCRRHNLQYGTFAEYTTVPEGYLAPKPPSLSFAEAAALPLAGLTAHQCLEALGLRAGETLFLDGGSGGVGHVAVQLAVARGARVIATASARNQDFLRELGAEPVDYGAGVRRAAPRRADRLHRHRARAARGLREPLRVRAPERLRPGRDEPGDRRRAPAPTRRRGLPAGAGRRGPRARGGRARARQARARDRLTRRSPIVGRVSDGLPHGVSLVPLTTHVDERGSFTELHREAWGTGPRLVQWNAVASQPRVLRGVHVHLLHADYLTVVAGRALVGLRDLRAATPTPGAATLVELRADAMAGIAIPPGVAHGFYFPERAMHVYAVSHYWSTGDELGCRWDDPGLGLAWPDAEPLVSARDAAATGLGALLAQLEPHQAALAVARDAVAGS
jgi:dTDP-4-dehydrorhamnose 3,5-epimerase-like enzyme